MWVALLPASKYVHHMHAETLPAQVTRRLRGGLKLPMAVREVRPDDFWILTSLMWL